MILRLSQKLAKKIHESRLCTAEPDPNPYLDWHATLFTHRRVQYIMAVNSASLFTVFMHGAGVTDISRLLKDLGDIIEAALGALSADLIYRKIIAPGFSEVKIAKAQDKRIIGSMNEQVSYVKFHLDLEEMSPFQLAELANGNLLSYLDYARPREAFLGMRVG
jgi:hypothetical protein